MNATTSGRRLGEHAPSILVAALSSAFGVALLDATGVLSTIISTDPSTARSGTAVPFLLTVTAIVFIAIAVYTGAVVTANTFATIVAGRTREIALMRLIGSSAQDERRRIAREGLLVGVVGSLVGAVAGTVLVIAGVRLGIATATVPDAAYNYVPVVVVLPIVAVALTTWAASWVGSRRVLVVSPMAATGAAVEPSREEAAGHRARNAIAIALAVVGVGLLVLGMVVGLVTPLGVLVGVVGGLVSFSGVVIGAHLILPPVLRLLGRAFGRSAPARLAAENAVRYPERSVRSTIGLVIGVTLVTMFAVAMQSYLDIIHRAQASQPELYEGVDTVLVVTTVVFSVITGFSAVIAAVGMVNNLSLSLLQRTRELGLLRALGFSVGQVRRMVVAESASLTLAALVVGLALGGFYGWAGAQSLLGSINGAPGLVVPSVPPMFLVGAVVLAAALTAAAAVAPTRRATRIAPVAALAAD